MSDQCTEVVPEDLVMWVWESEWSHEGIRVGRYKVPLDGEEQGVNLHPHPLEGEFPPLAEAGLRLQWMGKRWYRESTWPVWTLCIYRASVHNDRATLHKGGLVMIKPMRHGKKRWRILTPEYFEWRQMQGSLLSVIEHAISILKDK